MPLDFRTFLGRTESYVVPVFEPGIAWIGERRVDLRGATPGWWKITLKGRKVERRTKVETPGPQLRVATLEVKGHLARMEGVYWLCQANGDAERVHFAPEEEPPQFSPLVAYRHASGDLFWNELGWETGSEEEVRRAFEENRGLEGLKGVPSTLRHAFALATVDRASRTLRIPASPGELQPFLRDICQRGAPGAQVALATLARARREAEEAARRAAPVEVRAPVPRPAPVPPPALIQDDLEARLELSLHKSGARFLSTRRLGEGLTEVTWQYKTHRLLTVVHVESLRVRDAGVCLTSHVNGEKGDDKLTLDSLPGVIEQAIRERKLVITRRDGYTWDRDDEENDDDDW